MSVVVDEPRVAPPVLDEETRDVLRKAKGFVSKDWGQGQGSTPPRSPSVCILTALCRANDCNPVVIPTHPALAALEILVGAMSIINWNDTPGRTQAEVIDLFDKALTA